MKNLRPTRFPPLFPQQRTAAAIPVSYTHLDVYKRQNRSNIKAVHRTGFLARWTAFFCHIYKYEESKKSFNVIPTPWQILSIVSTFNCPPRRAVLWICRLYTAGTFRSDHKYRYLISCWTEFRHQFITIHNRHHNIRNDQKMCIRDRDRSDYLLSAAKAEKL